MQPLWQQSMFESSLKNGSLWVEQPSYMGCWEAWTIL